MTNSTDSPPVSTGDSPGFSFLHQPFWCEENAWHLSAHTAFTGLDVLVAMVTGMQAGWHVRCRSQRAGGARGVLDWDYHVLVFVRAAPTPGLGGARASASTWQAWDPDSTLPLPCPAATWLDETFLPAAPRWLSPRFRVFSGVEYRRTLSSDRAHMRSGERWHKPPPPWPPIGDRPANLFALLDPLRPAPGEVLDLAALHARLAGRA